MRSGLTGYAEPGSISMYQRAERGRSVVDFAREQVEDAVREQLRAYMQREGIAQTECARRIGISQSALSRFLLGETPEMRTKVLANAYALCPDLRPIVHDWLRHISTSPVFAHQNGAPESPACEQGSAA